MAGIGWAPLGGESWTWRWCIQMHPLPFPFLLEAYSLTTANMVRHRPLSRNAG